MSKFIIEKTVNASIEKTFQVFSNYEMFPKIISRYYPSVIVRSRRGDVAVVAEHLRLLDKEFIIMAKHSVKQPNLHETVVVGGDIKGSYINEQFFAVPEGTKLKIEAELKRSLFGFIINPQPIIIGTIMNQFRLFIGSFNIKNANSITKNGDNLVNIEAFANKRLSIE